MTGFLLAAAMTVQVGSIAALPLPPPNTVSASYQGGEALILANHAVIGIGADAEAGKTGGGWCAHRPATSAPLSSSW